MIGASKTARAILDVHIIGDDLICTNSVLLQKAIAEKAWTCMVRKPNQVGTIRGDSRTAKGQCMALLLPSGQAALRSDERGSFLTELIRAESLYLGTRLSALQNYKRMGGRDSSFPLPLCRWKIHGQPYGGRKSGSN